MARILVADDDYRSLDAISAAIEAEGHEVIQATDGIDALEKAETADLALLDTELPVFNGFEISEQLRNGGVFPADTPILLISTRDQDIRRVMRVGAEACLDKSTLLPSLRDVLAKYLGQKAGR